MTQHEGQDLIGCLVLVDSVNCVANDISAITKVKLVVGLCGLQIFDSIFKTLT